MIVHQFYRCSLRKEDTLIAVLPERRKVAHRITHQSVMNWARLLVPEGFFGERNIVYFVRVEIESAGCVADREEVL